VAAGEGVTVGAGVAVFIAASSIFIKSLQAVRPARNDIEDIFKKSRLESDLFIAQTS
jgi:hypothetical protein